ncbi:MAG: methylmalonyl-CoA carboxyltransferase [Bacteroidales bacterium]|nr:carboxyl transferase [Clostridium sp.]MCM1203102.1 methylmalonyl-CoA carboxyltransferase [Bacteroidales bacterium]
MSNKLMLSASDRITSLLDDSSFVEVGAYVTARNTDFNTQEHETPADGVVTGYGTIDGRLVYVYSQDATVLGGSVGEMHAAKIAKIYDMALKMGAPVIGLVDCAGLRLQEATDALNAFGSIYLKQSMASGVIPQITGVFGVCGGGSTIIPALSDITFMVKDKAKLFVNSPNALEQNYVEKLDTAGAEYQQSNSALVDEVLEDDLTLLGRIRQIVGWLPSHNEDDANFADGMDDLNREIPNLEGLAEDARAVLTHIADNNVFIELKKEYAKDMVIGFIKLNGTTVGCVANQVKDGGDVLSTKGAYIAAEFVNFLDAFNIPVLTLTNVKGYKATVAEEAGIAKAVAKLTYAFANATVPKVNLVMGDALGSAYLAMNSKSVGADIEYAWSTAKIGTMNPEQAVKIIYAGDQEKAAAAKAEYTEKMSSAVSAAKRGYVDDIIDGAATRKRLIAAYEMLYTKREDRPLKKHGAV